MLLGGRTAEEMIFVDPTTGAADDIEKATNIARKMVMEYGMSDRLGPMRYGKPEGEVFLGKDYARQQDYSDEIASKIDEEVRYLINQAHEEAREILSAHRSELERIAEVLIEKESVDADEVREIFAAVPKWEHDESGSMRIRSPREVPLREGIAAVRHQERRS
jgi:cell division protease FtsH